jgi:hypothetical protein
VGVDTVAHRELRLLDDAGRVVDFGDNRVGIVLRKDRYCAVAEAAPVLEAKIRLVNAKVVLVTPKTRGNLLLPIP